MESDDRQLPASAVGDALANLHQQLAGNSSAPPPSLDGLDPAQIQQVLRLQEYLVQLERARPTAGRAASERISSAANYAAASGDAGASNSALSPPSALSPEGRELYESGHNDDRGHSQTGGNSEARSDDGSTAHMPRGSTFADPSPEEAITDAASAFSDAEQQHLEPTGDSAAQEEPPTGSMRSAGNIGRFEVLRVLGRGGQGLMLLANDPVLARNVALKVPWSETLITPKLRSRFLREARAVARLTHPHIVAVYEVGEVGPVCFIASALVEGNSLAQWLREHQQPLDARQAAALVAGLADAMQYAHEQGVLHRDLKPGNVMLEPRESGSPGVGQDQLPWTAKITDFGLAKFLDDEREETRTGTLLGTPAYMSPEQAAGEHKSIGPASDVYSLGAILYELLTQRPPFRGASDTETLRLLANVEPAPPRRTNPQVPLDLQAITLKCLEKDPQRRYATAGALIDDLRRFLAGESITARQTGVVGNLARWSRRNPLVATLGMLVLLAFSLGTAASAYFALQSAQRATLAVQAQQAAEAQRDLAQRNSYVAQIRVAQEAWNSGSIDQCLSILGRLVPREGEIDLRGFEYFYLWKLCHQSNQVLIGHNKPVMSIAQSADGQRLVSGGVDGKVLLWDMSSQEFITLAEGLDDGPGEGRELNVRGVRGVAISHDGRTAAAATLRHEYLWDLESKERLLAIDKENADCWIMAFSPDGKTLATNLRDNSVEFRDVPSGNIRCKFALPSSVDVLPHNTTGLAFAPDESFIAVGVGPAIGEQTVYFLNQQGQLIADMKPRVGNRAAIVSMAISSDSQWLAVGSADQTISIWNLRSESAKPERVLSGHSGFISAFCFLEDGTRCLSGSSDHTVRLWNFLDGRLEKTIRMHGDIVTGLLVSPSGAQVVSASGDATIRLWNLETSTAYREIDVKPPNHRDSNVALVTSVAIDPPDDEIIAVSSAVSFGGSIQPRGIKEAPSPRSFVDPTRANRAYTCGVLSPDRKTYAAAEGSFLTTITSKLIFKPSPRIKSDIICWAADSGEVVHRLEGHKSAILCLDFSQSSKLIASGDNLGGINLWSSGQRIQGPLTIADNSPIFEVDFSHDEKFVAASAPFSNAVCVWEVASGKEVARIDCEFPVSVTFAPDSKLLAIGTGTLLAERSSAHGEVTVWNWREGTRQATFGGHSQFVRRIFFTQHGERLWSVGFDGAAKLWDLVTGHEVISLTGNYDYAFSADLSADGDMLAVGDETGKVAIWDASIASEEFNAWAAGLAERTEAADHQLLPAASAIKVPSPSR